MDQSRFCQPLHDLVEFRTRIVKRPAVTTVEVMAGAIVGRRNTHLITNYIHKPYPHIYTILTRHTNYHSALLLHNTKNKIIPSLRQPGRLFRAVDGGEALGHNLNPTNLTIHQTIHTLPFKNKQKNNKQDITIINIIH